MWKVTNVMNEESMTITVQHTVLNCLSEHRRECQIMEKTMPEGLPVEHQEQQATNEETTSRAIVTELQLKHQKDLSRLKEEMNQQLKENQTHFYRQIQKQAETIRQKEDTIQEERELIHQQEETIWENEKIIKHNEQTIAKTEIILQQKEEEIQDSNKQTEDIMLQMDKLIQEKKKYIEEITKANEHIHEKKKEIQNKDEVIQQKVEEIRKKDEIIWQKEEEIRNKDEGVRATICQNEDTIKQKDEIIQQKEVEITELQKQLESRPWIVQLEELEITNEEVGDGAYGEVKVAIFRGTRVAAKCLHKIIVSRHNKGIFTREMDISSKIHHPNIIQFIGATRVNNPILLYELMATSLHERLQDDESLTHPQIIEICCDIASALCYLHQWKPDPILHRDVSSPNVLMEPLANNRWRSKLSDFGSASLQLHVKTVIPGNPAYAAPEAIIPQHHTPAMDVYSFGVLATEMTLHSAPEIDSIKRERKSHGIQWIPMKVIVSQCICNDRNQRLTSAQLLKELQKLT